MWNLVSSLRSDERRATFLAFTTLFGIMTAHGLLETARDALFLTSISPAKLPWAYLAIAALAMVVSALQTRDTLAGSGRQLAVFLGGSAVVVWVFWLVVEADRTWTLYAIYVWTGIFATLAVVQFWSIVNDLFTITQAKRLFSVISTGGVLGAIAGAGIARAMTEMTDARHLVAASGVVLALTVAGPIALCRATRCVGARVSDAERASERRAALEAPRLVWSTPYVRRLAVIVLVSTIALTAVDFLFKTLVAQHVAPEDLAEVFSTTYLVLNALSLAAVMFVARAATRMMGVTGALSLLPAGILAGVLGVLVSGALWAAFLLKGIDGALRYSVHRTALEVLYVPVSPDLRARVKNFIDVVGQRGGQAIASLGILAAAALMDGLTVIAAATLVSTVVWLLLAARLRPQYVDLFRKTLQEGASIRSVEFPQLDLASLETLIAALNSSSDNEVHATLDLLEEQGRVRLIPALILYHPSPSIVRHALDLFVKEGREDFLPIADRLIGHLDPQVRAAILRARAAYDPDPEMLYEYLGDPSAVVRATALAGLMSGEQEADDDTRAAIADILEGESTEGRVALARAVATQEGTIIDDILLALARDEEPAVRLEAARAMRINPSIRFLPELIHMLDRRELRNDAREVIALLGEAVLPELERALGDESLPNRVRLHVPRTIARISPEHAARVLLPRLLEELDGAIRYKVLRVLNSVRSAHPEYGVDRELTREAISRTLESAFRQLDWRMRLAAGARQSEKLRTAVHDLIVTMLEHKEKHAIDRLFRLLDLERPQENFRRIHRGLRSPDPKRRANSRELLENLLHPPVREAVIGLADGIGSRERLAAAGPLYTPRDVDYEGVLRALLAEGGQTIKALVVFHAGELKLEGLRPHIESLSADPGDVLAGTIQRAREQMASPG